MGLMIMVVMMTIMILGEACANSDFGRLPYRSAALCLYLEPETRSPKP